MNTRVLLAFGSALLFSLLPGCGSGKPSGPSGTPVTVASHHVVVVMEENQSYSSVVGNKGTWPNLNNLIAQGALPTNYYANMHGSISEYFMLTCGQILTDNDTDTQVWNVDNLARRMLGANVSFRVYAEGITNGYVGDDTGLYVVRHDPFALYSDVANNSTVADQVMWPFAQFATDLSANKLPQFSFIVPDINDDAHTGTPQQADSWLETNVIKPLSANPAFQKGGDGVLLVVFDESVLSDTAHGGGHVAPVFWGPNVKAGNQETSGILYQHQSMLLTIMQLLGLPNPLGAASSAPGMGEFFVQGTTTATSGSGS